MALDVGIDLGARNIKVVAGQKKGPLFVVRRAFSLPVDLSTEPEAAILSATAALKERFGKAPGARLSLSGKELIIRYTQVPHVPFWRLKLLMDFEVREMAHQAGDALASDYNLVSIPGREGEETVLVAVVKEHFLEARFQAVTEACGVPRSGMPSSLALFNAFLHAGSLYEDEYVFLVDVGHRSVEFILQKNGELLFARNIAAGGFSLTEAVAQGFGMTLDQAEQVKQDYGNVTPKGLASYTSGKEEKVANALIGPVGQLSSMIQSSLAFSRAQTGIRDLKVGRILLSGGGANLRGLTDYLSSNFGCPVERFQPENGLDLSSLDAEEAEEFETDPGRFAVALGLAVSATKDDAFLVDLVPASVRKKRDFTSKTVFMYAAAAVALLFLVATFFAERNESKRLQSASMKASREAGKARRQRQEFDQEQRLIEEINSKAAALVKETRAGYALAIAQRLVQAACPENCFVEQLEVKFVKDRQEDKNKPHRKRSVLLVEAQGRMLTKATQATQSLGEMKQKIMAARPGTWAQIVGQNSRQAGGLDFVEFRLEIDPFHESPPASGNTEEEAGGN